MNKRWIRLLAAWPVLWGALAFSQGALAQEEPLDPDLAFRFSARVVDATTLEARWQIADGYYLYRDKFRFELSGATLGKVELPPGKIKQDEYFGRVETYRKDVRILLPIERAAGATEVKLTTVSQGCADAGLCYVPQTVSATLKLPAQVALPIAAPPRVSAMPQEPPAASSLPVLASLSLDGSPAPTLLPPEAAFRVAATMPDALTVRFDYATTPDTYLYRDKLAWTVKSPADIKIARATTPAGEVKEDPSFGRTEVYHRDFSATLALSRPLAANETLVLEAVWQGCNEAVGVCYAPINREFTFGAGGAATPSATAAQGAVPGEESDTSRLERVLKSGNFWLIVATYFGAGLLLSLTPCVFPMIPILSGIIAGQRTRVTRTSGFLLSLAYVLGMAITYAFAGVAAALSGTLISNALQNPWALGIGAGVFVLLAFSMFGFFEIQLPSFIQSKFSDASNRMKGGNFAGVFVMGALSAVIVGPCVAPPLAAALVVIAQTGDTVLGGAALFMLALGMGVPLLLVGLSAGTLLPRAGAWMNAVKYFFGVLMLAIAVYLISPIIPAWVHMLLWALLLIGSAVYLHALDPLPERASGWMRLWKALGVTLLIGGLALIVGLLGGSRDVLQPLAVFQGGGTPATGQQAMTFITVKTPAELDTRLAAARAEGKPVMLDFYADWCVSCKEMERFTFSDARVQERLAGAVLLKADVTETNADSKALLKRFDLFGPPGIIFWRADGTQSAFKVVGFEKAEKFLASIDSALGR